LMHYSSRLLYQSENSRHWVQHWILVLLSLIFRVVMWSWPMQFLSFCLCLQILPIKHPVFVEIWEWISLNGIIRSPLPFISASVAVSSWIFYLHASLPSWSVSLPIWAVSQEIFPASDTSIRIIHEAFL
jgi:hypothetical protein